MSDTPVRSQNPDLTRTFQTKDESAEITAGSKGSPSSLELPERIGDYRLIAKLGEGGMGAVYRALDTRLQREVALKVMLADVAANAISKERFLREAQAVAALKHDHIVTIYQVGEENGVPFLAMELLEGMSLNDRLHENKPLSWLEILRIGRDIARGLAVAHAKGMIHRDIKPGNIWLETVDQSTDGSPQQSSRVKILDFGLARPISDSVHLTSSGAIIGTPTYMAPEQASGDPVDGRSDLFSLGVLLYRLCSGRLPFQGKDVLAVLTALAVKNPEPLSKIKPDVPVKLQNLIGRLLAKNPDERPASAQLVVTELQNMISELDPHSSKTVPLASLVAADPWADLDEDDNDADRPTVSHVGVRTDVPKKPPRRRNRLWLGMAFFALLIAGGVIIIVKTKDGKEAQVEVPDGSKVVVNPDGKVIVELPKENEKEKPLLPRDPVLVKAGEPLSPRALVPRPGTIPGVRSWTIGAGGNSPWVTSVAWNKDSSLIAIDDRSDNSVRIWNRQAQLQKVLLGHDRPVFEAAFSPDGKLLASSSYDSTVRLWQVTTGTCLRVIPLGDGGQGLAFSQQGNTLAVAMPRGLALIDVGSGRVRKTDTTTFFSESNSVAWSPDGSQLITGAIHGKLSVLNAETLEQVFELDVLGKKTEIIACVQVAWSVDGKWLAARGSDGQIRIWEAKTRELKHTIDSEINNFGSLKWSKDNRRLLASGTKNAFAIWDGIEGKLISKSDILKQSPRVAWSNDEAEIAVITDHLRILGGRTGMDLKTVSPDGISPTLISRLFTEENLIADKSGPVILYDADTGRERRRLDDIPGWYQFPSPQGDRFASMIDTEADRPFALLIDSTTGKKQKELKPPTPGIFSLDWSPDGRWIGTGHLDGVVRIWNSETAELKHELKAHEGSVFQAFWSPDGKQIASIGIDKAIQVWDPFAEKRIATLKDFSEMLFLSNSGWNWSPKFAWKKDGRSFCGLFFGSDGVGEVEIASGKWNKRDVFETKGTLSGIHYTLNGEQLVISDNQGWHWLQNVEGKEQKSSGFIGDKLALMPDSRRCYSLIAPHFGYDFQTKRRLGVFLPNVAGESIVIGPEGHYRGSANIDQHIVYVVQFEDGRNETFTPAAFAKKFNWKNDPSKARFLKLDE